MRFYIFIVFFLAIQKGNAQDYFHKIIPFDFGNPTILGLYEWDNQYIIPLIYPGEISSIISTNLEQYDYFHFSYFDFTRSPLTNINNELYAFAKDRAVAKGLKLAKLTDQFEFAWEREIMTKGEYNFGTSSIALNQKIYNSFIVEENEIKKIGISQYNTDGDSIWTRYYEDNIGYSYIWTLSPTLDQKMLGSYTIRYKNETKGFPKIMKFDSNGDVIWKSESFEEVDNGAEPIWLTQLSDSSIIYAYRVFRWNDPIFVGNNWSILPMRMVWLNKNGENIQEAYMVSPFNEQMHLSGLEKGQSDYFFAYGKYAAAEDQFGFITKYNNQGDTLWNHKYQHPDFETQNISHSIRDIIEDENGDITALARILPSGEAPKIWLFRVNADGCFSSAPCDTIVSSIIDPKPIVNDQNLSLYPNPAVDELTIDLTNSAMVNIQAFDINGTLLLQKNIDAKKYELNVQDWKSGMYLVKVVSKDGKYYLQKFVKQ